MSTANSTAAPSTASAGALLPDFVAQITGLVNAAVAAHDSADALRWSQAACNTANAMCAARNATALPYPPVS
jgi:hypothetical protein